MFNILKYYKIWFAISGLIFIFGLASLGLYGLNLGIDFKGGTLSELQFKQAVETKKVKDVLENQGLKNFQIQTTENFGIIIKTESLEKSKYDEITTALRTQVGEFTEKRLDSIGPVIGKELKRKAIYELILVSLGIIFYIAYAFRKVAKPITSWMFGTAAIIALFHDLLFVLGTFSLLGHFKGVEVDSMFVTAMLTVLGFSVHDTIVVFDRIRENLKLYAGRSIEFVVNYSISQTIVRSINTSMSVLFVLFSLLLFGGDTIKYFVLTLFIGIAIGTYSSIFIASPILVLWHKWKVKRL